MVSSETRMGVKQSRGTSGLEEVTETVVTHTAVGGWAWLISSLLFMILLTKKFVKFSLLEDAGMHRVVSLRQPDYRAEQKMWVHFDFFY